MADWDNTKKNGVNNPLWGDYIQPWDLSLPWQYENPTPIDWDNKSKS